MHNLLVPIDFSDITQRVVQQAAELARTFGGTIRLLHVAPPDPSFAHASGWPQEVRDELAKELMDEHRQMEAIAESLHQQGLSAKALLTRGDVAERILELARKTQTDLIILGARRKGALAELIPGSVLRSVLRQASCPVLVLPEGADELDPNGGGK